MSSRILLVEDEILIAFNMEGQLLEMGHRLAGIAPDSTSAMELADGAEIALVDLNLKDGPTGIDVGRKLAANGVTVTYMSADPTQIGGDIPGTLGVIAKPIANRELQQAVDYAEAVHRKSMLVTPPTRMRLFQKAA